MERFLLYWDDLDDLMGTMGLFAERIRRIVMFALGTLLFIAALAGAIALALVEPPLAMAAVTLVFVTLMYRSVTHPRFRRTPG